MLKEFREFIMRGNVLNFLVITLALFLVIKAANSVMRAKAEAPVPPAPTAEEKLLTEIRDLLAAQSR